MALTDNEVRILSLIDQRYWETGSVVTNEKLAEDLKLSKQVVENAWKKPDFRQALVARGIDLDPARTEGILTPAQIMVANLLCNTFDKRSVREKLEFITENTGIEISTQQYNAWMRDPSFSGYLRKRAEAQFVSADASAYRSLVEAVENGDFNSIKLFFEMRQIYNPKLQIDVNIEVIVAQLIEIVARHVTDPVALQAIADDVERLELSGSPASQVERRVDALQI